MLFNSIEFLVFFPTVVLLYFASPYRYRWILLLIASYYFYMSWRAEYIVLLVVSTLVDYTAGLKIAATKRTSVKRGFLCFSLAVNLGILFFFKYYNFFSSLTNDVISGFDVTNTIPTLNVLLPIGISFYTFQTIGYTIDVYFGRIKPERHLGMFALYVSFFPQLVAGPIERASNLLPQFRKRFDFDYERVVDGLKLMGVGLFKKVVIADNLGIFVEQVYGDPTKHSSLSLTLATIAFTYQIYGDFSGYSDMAIGGAKVLGIDLMKNFNRPFAAKNLTELWRRLHISLTAWLRDYVYIPLGGNSQGPARTSVNLLIVFMLSGFWHGAAWTFIVWGAFHGITFVLGRLTFAPRKRLANALGLTYFPGPWGLLRSVKVFAIFSFSGVFFRAESLGDSWHIMTHMFTSLGSELFSRAAWANTLSYTGSPFMFKVICELVVLMELIQYWDSKRSVNEWLKSRSTIIRWAIYISAAYVILLFGNFEGREFVYFQF